MKYNEINKFSNPRHEALMGVWWTGLLMKQLARNVFRHLPLTETQFNVLLILRVAESPLTQQQMSERLLVDKSNLTGLIDRMEAAGLVARGEVPGDRRRHALEMTAKGKALLAEAEPIYTAAVEKAMSKFTKKEIADITHYMLRLHAALESAEG